MALSEAAARWERLKSTQSAQQYQQSLTEPLTTHTILVYSSGAGGRAFALRAHPFPTHTRSANATRRLRRPRCTRCTLRIDIGLLLEKPADEPSALIGTSVAAGGRIRLRSEYNAITPRGLVAARKIHQSAAMPPAGAPMTRATGRGWAAPKQRTVDSTKRRRNEGYPRGQRTSTRAVRG